MTALKGKVALVTGSGRGLGQAYARDLAKLGCCVVVNSPARPDGASAISVADELNAAGHRAVAYVGAIDGPQSAQAATETALTAFGRLDILVCNAGIILNKPFEETTTNDLDHMFRVHFRGPFAMAQAALPAMRANGWGRIVLTSSGSASFGLNGQSAYASAKAAIIGLTHVLRVEAPAPEVMINALLPVAPPLGRTPASLRIAELYGDHVSRLEPDWVAPLVSILCSDACPGSGDVYSAVGGRYARVFTAACEGWSAPGDTPPDLAAMAAHADRIRAETGYSVPASILDEIEIAALTLARGKG